MRSQGQRASLVYSQAPTARDTARTHTQSCGQTALHGEGRAGGASVVSRLACLDSKEVTHVACKQRAIGASATWPSRSRAQGSLLSSTRGAQARPGDLHGEGAQGRTWAASDP